MFALRVIDKTVLPKFLVLFKSVAKVKVFLQPSHHSHLVTMLARSGFNLNPGYSVRPGIRRFTMINYLCLVPLNKQQIYEGRTK